MTVVDNPNKEPNGDRPLLRGEISCRLAMFIAEFVLAYGVPRLVIGFKVPARELIDNLIGNFNRQQSKHKEVCQT